MRYGWKTRTLRWMVTRRRTVRGSEQIVIHNREMLIYTETSVDYIFHTIYKWHSRVDTYMISWVEFSLFLHSYPFFTQQHDYITLIKWMKFCAILFVAARYRKSLSYTRMEIDEWCSFRIIFCSFFEFTIQFCFCFYFLLKKFL